MKKFRLFIIPLLIVMLSVNILASTTNNGVYEFETENKVVVFEEISALTTEQQRMVAERLVYGVPEDDGISTYAWCWLIGHNFTYDLVSVITHKKSAYSPRCYQQTYNVETCTRCDHMSEEYLGAVYIVCCPED